MNNDYYGLGKVKRIHSACCGMENGKTYKAMIRWNYVSVELPNGKWTAPHFCDFTSEDPFFEIIEKLEG